MYDWLLKFLWYSLLLNSSTCLIQPRLLILTNMGYQDYVPVLIFLL